ncbi:hypothetical protein V7S43_017659 [Phytophthora oleae]|uniref:PiggyBac transposable element-derived protein domain-containing protein n=1 Tax=Phytophthora oleae TaxID=2107226 RepID=A0ABD3EWC5_9STRA
MSTYLPRRTVATSQQKDADNRKAQQDLESEDVLEEKAPPDPRLLEEINQAEAAKITIEQEETEDVGEIPEEGSASEEDVSCKSEPSSQLSVVEATNKKLSQRRNHKVKILVAGIRRHDWTRSPPWDKLDLVDSYFPTTSQGEGTLQEEEDIGTSQNASAYKELVAVDSGNGMNVCMVPEPLIEVQRSPLEAELEDVRETKRLRLLDSQPQRMTLRSAEERHSPKRYDDFHVYASFCKREPAEGAGLASEKQKNWHIRDVKIPKTMVKPCGFRKDKKGWLECVVKWKLCSRKESSR